VDLPGMELRDLHTEMTIERKQISSWSIGCLCGLAPQFMPVNKWNHGFATSSPSGS